MGNLERRKIAAKKVKDKYTARKPSLIALKNQMMAESPNEADSIEAKWDRKLAALDVEIARLQAIEDET